MGQCKGWELGGHPEQRGIECKCAEISPSVYLRYTRDVGSVVAAKRGHPGSIALADIAISFVAGRHQPNLVIAKLLSDGRIRFTEILIRSAESQSWIILNWDAIAI